MERRFLQALFALSVLLVLLISMLPAIAQAPESVLIKPLATCVDGKCTMSEADYRTLQRFHEQRFQALQEAADVIDRLQAMNAEMMRKFQRFAMGCMDKHT